MDFEQMLAQVQQPAGLTGLMIQIGIVFLATVVFNFLQKRLVRRVLKRLEATPNRWDDIMANAARRPLTILIWILGLSFIGQIVAAQTEAPIFGAVVPARDVGIIATVVWFVFRLIAGAEALIVERGELNGRAVDVTTVDAIAKLLRVLALVTGGLFALQPLGFSVSGFLAFGGVGGLAVGFAAKDLLANFFGGLMIYLDRPFEVGDWVRSPDREIEGTVEKIGWRLTCIRTFDKRPLYVPNSSFASIALENPSRMSHRRIYETIGVRYEDAEKLPAIVADVERMLVEHPGIDSDQTLMVNFNSFGASSLEFFIYTFTRTTVWTEYHQVKEDVLFRASRIIANHRAEIAFPTSTLQIPDGLRLHEAEQPQPARNTA